MGADIRILSTDVTEALQSYVERRLHFPWAVSADEWAA